MRRISSLLALGCLLTSLLAAAERWSLQYFYDKDNSRLAFTDLQFPSASYGVALGGITENRRRKPVIALTSDGGRTWNLAPLKEPGLTLFLLNEKTGWMTGLKGKLWKTSDGGRTWVRVPAPHDTKADPQRDAKAEPLRVFFLDESQGWLLCTHKQVYGTEDGGRTWQPVPVAQKPDVPPEITLYTTAAFYRRQIGIITGFSRLPDSRSRLPDWTQPDLIPLGRSPTTSIILISPDGGKSWKHSLLRNVGEIVRVRISSAGKALMLLQHPESFSMPSEIIDFDLKTLRGQSAYADKSRYVTDIAFTGAARAFAAAIDQEGRTPFPAIPGKLKILQSVEPKHWSEMEVDYRAEARSAVFAVADGNAWLATDTGMILKLVSE